MLITKSFHFEAAHRLDQLPEDHKCYGWHGHNYEVIVALQGPLNSVGMVMDYGELKATVMTLINQLDHKCLNDIKEIGHPTAEHIAIWFWKRLKPGIPQLCWIEVKETPGTSAIFAGADHE